ncbi:MAG: FAD:protein FMN transferase [Actinomycetes bacterium]
MTREFRHTEFCMGTVFRFVGRTNLPENELSNAVNQAIKVLHDADEIFSLYKPDSPLSKLARGDCSVSDCPEVVSTIWDECENWTKVTDGWFSPFTPEHTFDPSGLVKTWAANKSAQVLEQHGISNFAMNAGGDIRLSQDISSGVALQIGISKPITIASPEAGVLTVVNLNGSPFRAVATSGTAERGDHIWNPKLGSAWATSSSQVTVVAQDIVTADVWATALFAAGENAVELVEKNNLADEIAVLIVGIDGELTASKNFGSLLNPV